ncbi:MAG: GntR family transcriptional regulator [Bacteroidota bacterium]|nr:GntR family transcriptional regulator [Bacteroidota bacterium]
MSMEFKPSKSIFLQIAETICRQVMEGTLQPGDRVPSLRDLAAEYEVNRNTLMRTFSLLSADGIIENKRGVGFYVSDNAIRVIFKIERTDFFTNELPDIIQKAKLLKLTSADMTDLLNQLKLNDSL